MTETIEERLKKIAKSNTSTEDDEHAILYLLRTSGLSNAVVTCGLVYPFGQGKPMSIQQVAQSILDTTKKKIKKVI